MTAAEIANLLETTFGAKITGKNLEVFDPWVEVAPEAIVEVSRFCLTDSRLALDYLKNESATDFLLEDAKKAEKLGIAPHLEVVYHLFSFTHKHEIVLKVKLPRWQGDKVGEIPSMPSVYSVWKIADWHEREIFDLFGIHFEGHPNLRRILCAEDWVGYPLRKDYEFPLEYHGIRCK